MASYRELDEDDFPDRLEQMIAEMQEEVEKERYLSNHGLCI